MPLARAWRQLLAAGHDTTALRTEIAALERRMEDITVMIAARGPERERKEAAVTAGLAAALAKEATRPH